MKKKVEIFLCYARKDQELLQELKKRLIPLQRQDLINIWHDADINLGSEWEEEIKKHLNAAHIVLLLITPDFMASEYCYNIEMVRAVERHKRGEARVIPVILRSVHWQWAPFGKLQALPKNALPLNKWSDRDDALFDIAEGIREVAEELVLAWGQAENQAEQKVQTQQAEDRSSILPGRLKPKQVLKAVSGGIGVVEELLGSGGQGEVYRVTLAGNLSMALKWYFPHMATQEQWQALETLVKSGPPNERFLWPLDLVRADKGAQFGYLMPLRAERFKSIVDLMKFRIKPDPTFQTLTIIGRQLADGYFQLHVRGLCCQDISFGNIFFDPRTGEVLICDNDNVTVNGSTGGGVLGTARFMAPEIVRGEALPSTETDRFSLSVLLFYLFTLHHPLEGKREADIRVFDQAAMTQIYGIDPLFIFDPNNDANRPVKGYQDNALFLWPIYPQFLRDLFTRAFTDGLTDPKDGRVLESEWRSAMVRLHDSVFYCARCQSQNFYDIDAMEKNGGTLLPCWNCKQQVILPYRICIGSDMIMLNADTRLYPHHIDRWRKWDFSRPVAQVDPDRFGWGLKNVSSENWVITKPDGTRQGVAIGQDAPLAVGVRIHFGPAEGEIRY